MILCIRSLSQLLAMVLYIRSLSQIFAAIDPPSRSRGLYHALAQGERFGKLGLVSLEDRLRASLLPGSDTYTLLGKCLHAVRIRNNQGCSLASSMRALQDFSCSVRAPVHERCTSLSDEHIMLLSFALGCRIVCLEPSDGSVRVRIDTHRIWCMIGDDVGSACPLRLKNVLEPTHEHGKVGRRSKEFDTCFVYFHKKGDHQGFDTNFNYYFLLQQVYKVSCLPLDDIPVFFNSRQLGKFKRMDAKACEDASSHASSRQVGKYRKRRYNASRGSRSAPGGRVARAKNSNSVLRLQAKRYRQEHGSPQKRKRDEENLDTNNVEEPSDETRLRTQRRKRSKTEDSHLFSITKELTFEALEEMLRMDPRGERMFFDSLESPEKAVLLHYLNSGLFGFQRWKDYSSKFGGSTMDSSAKESLRKEILEEMLSDGELQELVQKFLDRHSFVQGFLPSCGACGIREWERPCKKSVAYERFCLNDTFEEESHPLLYTELETRELNEFKSKDGGTVTIPRECRGLGGYVGF